MGLLSVSQVLRLDIEGGEFEVLESLLHEHEELSLIVDQISIEVHCRTAPRLDGKKDRVGCESIRYHDDS